MMEKKLIFSIVFIVVFSISLVNGMSIVVNAQENIQEDEFSNTTLTFTKIFGEPFYKELSSQDSSIVLNVEGGNIKTHNIHIATGFLKDVGNVTDKSTFITIYQSDDNTFTSIGNGNITTIDGEIATYTGHDLGITDKDETQTYRGIQIFKTDSDGKLAFLDNLIGLYEYKNWANGTKSGIMWEWN